MLTELAANPWAKVIFHNRAVVATVYSSMVRRAPDVDLNRYLAGLMDQGATVKDLVGWIWGLDEYRARFA